MRLTVLCRNFTGSCLDYDAKGPDELSLMAHEVLNVYDREPRDEDFLLAERGQKTGSVPRAYIKIIS